MVSPETDSGFVGSETSIVSPFTQTPEHRFSRIRYSNPPFSQAWDILKIQVSVVAQITSTQMMVPVPVVLTEGKRGSRKKCLTEYSVR